MAVGLPQAWESRWWPGGCALCGGPSQLLSALKATGCPAAVCVHPPISPAHPSGARSIIVATSGHLVNGADGPVTTSGGSSCPCHPPEQPPGEATSVPQA
ncbi:hypothetical protein CapIbe_019062 [Capra ibex]